jgi:hypothetical protein
MFKPIRKDVRIARSADSPDGSVRPWGEPITEDWRDTRPGRYAVTGTFIEPPDQPETKTGDSVDPSK